MAESEQATTRRKARGVRDRVIGLRRVRAGDLTAHPLNWRAHPDAQRRALRGLLAEIGYADALLARETDDGGLQLIDGHLRASLDPEQVIPVLVLDLDEAEAAKLLLTLDPLASMAEADPLPLSELLARTETSSAAVRDLLQDLSRSAGLPTNPGITDPDDVPEPAEPRCSPGDLWILGEHRVCCADASEPQSYERLLHGRSADMVWTDPPYGVGYVGKTKAALTIRGDEHTSLRPLLQRSFGAIDDVLAPGSAIYVCHPAGPGSVAFLEAFIEVGWSLRQTLVWVKDSMVLGHSDYHYRHEPIVYGIKPGAGRRGRGRGGWYGGNDQDSVFEVARPKASREHPTTKPVELVRRCLTNSSEPGAAVLDPFLGSGTTLIAAEELGRRCVGMELDPTYVDVAVARWEAFTGSRATKEE